MRNVLLLLVLLPQWLAAQECHVLESPRRMGIQRALPTLEDEWVKTLPLVFHIVHTGGQENITDAQVLSSVQAANEHFREGDVDTKIDWCLAQRDPQDNPTSGITRYNASAWPEYVADGVASSSTFDGFDDFTLKSSVGCWNPDEYVNVYIVSEINGNDAQGGTQGYAYLGPTGDCRDGVVVLYNVTGTEGELKPSRNQSKTLTHELGHYLTLYHTFSNTNSCNPSGNCETSGDFVCDTPPTTLNTGCSSSCEAMVENFMDYTSQDCKTTFSVGQAERMHGCLLGAREDLPFSAGCVPSVEYDVTIADVTYETPWCTTEQDVWVTIVNQGTEAFPWVDVDLYCNGEQLVQTVPNLGPSASASVFFEGVYVEGAQLLEVQVFSPLDEYLENNYMGLPLETFEGTLATIEVKPDIFAAECSWELLDASGEVVIGDDGYPFGSGQEYTYQTCLGEECYTLNAYDTAGDGMVFPFGGNGSIGVFVGLDTLAWIADEEYYFTSREFCNTFPACPLDYDGNGTIGNGDILVMLSYYGCEEDCPYDPNQDGMVSVQDLLYMLYNVGECEVELDFSPGTYLGIVTAEPSLASFLSGKPRIFDAMGRRVDVPFDQLASGVYILRHNGQTRKVFVQ